MRRAHLQPDREGRAARALIAALACLVLAGPLVATLHFAVETHRVCADHGAIEHVAPRDDAADPGPRSGEHRVPGAPEDGDRHDGCSFVQLGPVAEPDGEPPAAPAAWLVVCADRPASRPAPLAAEPVWRRAPKTSPPVVSSSL